MDIVKSRWRSNKTDLCAIFSWSKSHGYFSIAVYKHIQTEESILMLSTAQISSFPTQQFNHKLSVLFFMEKIVCSGPSWCTLHNVKPCYVPQLYEPNYMKSYCIVNATTWQNWKSICFFFHIWIYFAFRIAAYRYPRLTSNLLELLYI